MRSGIPIVRSALPLLLAVVLAGCTASAVSTRSQAPGAGTSGSPASATAAGAPAGSSASAGAAAASAGTAASAAPGTPIPAASEPGAQVAVRWPSPIPGVQPSPTFALQIPILMYHRIVPAGLAGDSLPGLVVSPALFDAQLAALHAAGWHTVTVAQISQALQLHRTFPPRTFAISIDDGWDDGYLYALPILQRYGYHATYYVIAGRVGTWRNVLTPDELRTLVADGMEIGDHTMNHLSLPSLSQAALHYQVETAAELIESFVGERPATLAYPAGRYDAEVLAEVQADGFGMAVIEGSGAWESAADRFTVPRVRVSPSTTPTDLVNRLQALEPGS